MWREDSKGGQGKKHEHNQKFGQKRLFDLLHEIVTLPEEKVPKHMSELMKRNPEVRWEDAFFSIDCAEPLFESRREAQNYLLAWKTAANTSFPYKRLLKRWAHTKTQGIIVYYLISLSPEKTEIYKSDTAPLVEREIDKYQYSKEMQQMVESNYNCEEIYQLAGDMAAEDGQHMLSNGISSAPELVCMGLINYYNKYEKIVNELFVYCIRPVERSMTVLRKIFEKRPKAALTLMAKLHSSTFSFEDCLNACLECKMLPYLMRELDPQEFSLDIIILAISKEIIDLGFVLCMQPNEDFVKLLLQHMAFKYSKGCAKSSNIYPLTVDMIISTCIALDMVIKAQSKATILQLNKLKSLLAPEIRACLSKKTSLRQIASEFLHNVIAGRTTNSDAIVYITQVSAKKSTYDAEIFECIIKEMEMKYNLVDKLSTHEAMTMALFYGRMIKYEILSSESTKRAMKKALAFLREDKDTNKFNFGLKMLETFCDTLEKYPFFCQEFSRMPQIYAVNKSLYAYIRGHLAVQRVSSKEEIDEGSSLAIEVVREIVGPVSAPTQMREVCTLAPVSLDIAIEALHKTLTYKKERIGQELAKYLVLEGILKEAAYLRAYAQLALSHSSFLLDIRGVIVYILNEYISMHKKIEKAEKISLMRTLGTYLGMLVFSKGAPPLMWKEMSIKNFLVESVGKGCIYSAVVFVCKYIEECINSRIIGPNSPYVQSILKILAEVHFLTEGSDLISLEVQICFSRIGLRIEDVYPGIAIQEKLFGTRKKRAGLAKYVGLEEVRNIMAHIFIIAMDFAVRDIAYSIVEKVMSICARATIEIVKRDFKKNQKKALQILRPTISSLAVRLAHASADGPIFSSITNNVMHFMKLAGMDDSISQEKVEKLARKNRSICLDLVEHITRKRVSAAINTIEEELVSEMNEYKGSDVHVPEQYILPLYAPAEYKKPSHILVEDIKPVTIGEYHETCAYLCSVNYKCRESSDGVGAFTGSSAQKKWEEIQRVLQEIEKSPNEEVKPKTAIELLESINVIVSLAQSGAHDMVCLFFCQNIIGSIFMLENRWARTQCIKAVQKICEASYNSQQEVSSWLVYAEDERKFNVEVFAEIIGHDILNKVEYDMHLASTLVKNPLKAKFAIDLLTTCLVREVPFCTPFDFVCTIEAITKSSAGGQEEKSKYLLKEIARSILLSKKEVHGREIFDNWTNALFYKVRGKERDTILSACVRSIEEKAKDPVTLRAFYKSAFQAGVEYYLRLRKECSPVKYIKIEALGVLVYTVAKENLMLSKTLEILTSVFLDAVEIKYYQAQALFTRLLQIILEGLSVEKEKLVYLYLEKIRPTRLGIFFGGYIEILFSEYIMRNMFLRNTKRGLSILIWVYTALEIIPEGAEKLSAVHACAVFALQLNRYCPSFYQHYSALFLCILEIRRSNALLRNAWCFDRHPSFLDIIEQHKEKVRNDSYYEILKRVHEQLIDNPEAPLKKERDNETLSHVLADGLSNQKESGEMYQKPVLDAFLSKDSLALKEQLLARLLEKGSVPSPRPIFVRHTLDILLNKTEYMDEVEEIMKKDKATLGKLAMHVSAVIANNFSK